MTDADFALIEKTLEIRLPDDYKEVLRNCPERHLPFLEELQNDYYAVLQENTAARQHAHLGWDDDRQEVPWPPYYFIVGNDGFGNPYFLDLNRARSPVFFRDHEFGRTQEVCSQIEQFLPYLVRTRNADAPPAM